MKFAIIALCLVASASALTARQAPTGTSKVVQLLNDLKAKVNREGEEEAITYNTYACYCRDTIAEISARIEQEAGQKDTAQAEINSAITLRDEDDTEIQTKTQAIAGTNSEISQLDADHHAETTQFNAEEMDLSSAIASLESAIQLLKATRASVSLVQAKPLAKQIEKALMLAQTLPTKTNDKVMTALLSMGQDPAADAADLSADTYEFRSGDVITTLENLKTSFADKKSELQATYLSNKQSYESLKQEKTQMIELDQSSLEETQGTKAQATANIQTYSADLSTVSSSYMQDVAFLESLRKQCSEKAQLWDQRSETRANEITALVSAINILADVTAFTNPPALVQAKPVSFLQVTEQKHEAPSKPAVAAAAPVSKVDLSRRSRLVALLKGAASKIHSASLLKAAQSAAEDPLARAKTLVKELTERLMKEMTEDVTHQTWCTKQINAAKEVREFKAKQIKETNTRLANTEARISELTTYLSELETDLTKLAATQNTTKELREQEKSENAEAESEATQGRAAVMSALSTIEAFYESAKKSAAAVSFIQTSKASKDAPDAGFDSGYAGDQGGSFGITAMLEQLKTNFEHTLSETSRDEDKAAQEYVEMKKKTEVEIGAKEEAKNNYAEFKVAAEAEDQNLRQKLAEYQATLQKTLTELEEYDQACNTGGETLEEKQAKRNEEVAALKQALCILDAHAEGSIEAC